MNPLIDKLPSKIRVSDEICDINADYRTCLKIILAYEDEELTMSEKHMILLNLLYKKVPKNIENAILQGIKFLDCGEQLKRNSSLKLYSFSKDAKYIYSAMSQVCHCDLEDISFLHWWKFCYYFLDISADSSFSNIIGLRQKKAKGKLSKEEKEIYLKSREIFDLDYSSEETEEESEFMKILNGGD